MYLTLGAIEAGTDISDRQEGKSEEDTTILGSSVLYCILLDRLLKSNRAG